MKHSKTFHQFILALTALFFFLPNLVEIKNINVPALGFVVFIGTFFIYRLSVWIPVISNRTPFFSFIESPFFLEPLSYVFIILIGYSLLSLNVILLLSAWGLLSIAYFTNVQIDNTRFQGLRSIPLIKTLLLSFMWTIIGFILQLNKLNYHDSFFFTISIRFIIIFLICLGVDLRDITKDQQAKTTTLATYFGFKKVKSFMLICSILLILLLSINKHASSLDLIISTGLFLIILQLKINQSKQTFTLLLDGTLFLYSLLNLIASYARFC
ncbi:MAG: hypothetical protein ACKOX3_10420 [Bacteroidota bacterium]